MILSENFTTNNCLVAHNTFINVSIEAGRAYSTGITFRDNIFYNVSRIGIAYHPSVLTNTNNFEGNPGFVDLANFNFRLVSSSPAVNKATDGTNQGANFSP